MTENKIIIVDADAIISFVAVNEVNHERVKTLMQRLATTQAFLLFPTTAICEAVTVLRRKLNSPEDAARIVHKLQSGDFPIQAVDEEILYLAATFFNPLGSDQNTLFDAVIAALAKKLHADAIFSFDEWYKKQGFPLVHELFTEGQQAV